MAAVNDGEDARIRYSVRDVGDGEIFLRGEAAISGEDVTVLGSIDANAEKRFLLIEWEREDGAKFVNHFFTNILDISYDYYVKCMKTVGFYNEFEGFEGQPQRSESLPYVFDF